MKLLLVGVFILLSACSDPQRSTEPYYTFNESTGTCSGLNKSQGLCGDFRSQSLENVDLSNKDLRGSNFSNTILKNINFSNSNLSGAIFSNTECEACVFSGAQIEGLRIQDSIFKSSDFKNSKASKSHWENSYLENNEFDGASFDLSYWKDNSLIENDFIQTSLSQSTFDSNHIYKNIFYHNDFRKSIIKDNLFLNHTGQVLALRANPNYEPEVIHGNSFFGVDFRDSLFLKNFFALNEFVGCSMQRSKIYENLFFSVFMNSALNNSEFFDNEVSSLLKQEAGETVCLQNLCSTWDQVQALSLYSQRNIIDSTSLVNANFTGSFLIGDLFLGNDMRSSVFERTTLLNLNFSSSNLKESTFENSTAFLDTTSTDQNIVIFQNSLLELANFKNFNPSNNAILKGRLFFINVDAKNASFENANLRRCIFRTTNFNVSINENTIFDLCQFDSVSTFPFDEDTAILKGMLPF